MQWTKEDIEAVAKARVSKQEKKTTDKWMWGGIIGIVAGGVVAYQFNVLLGYAVMAIALISILYYNSTLSKKQNVEKAKLFKEWQNEQRKEVK
jgi:uncharacterized membrane protein YfcA